MTEPSVRADIPDKEHNLVNSFYGVKHNDKNIIVGSCINSITNGNDGNEFDSVQERLEHVLYRCLNFSSKYVGMDELSGEKYIEDDDGDYPIYSYRLRGVDAYSQTFFSGSVSYHLKNTHMLFYLELMLWNQHNIIPSEFHNLNDKTIKIQRSSGNIEKAYINDSSIRLSRTLDKLVIRVLMENNELTKHVLISDIIELNPELYISIVIPNIDELAPDWVKLEYESWKQMINNKKDEINILKIE